MRQAVLQTLSHTLTNSGRRLAGCLGGQLLAGGFATGRFTSGLLGSCHFFCTAKRIDGRKVRKKDIRENQTKETFKQSNRESILGKSIEPQKLIWEGKRNETNWDWDWEQTQKTKSVGQHYQDKRMTSASIPQKTKARVLRVTEKSKRPKSKNRKWSSNGTNSHNGNEYEQKKRWNEKWEQTIEANN